jgi:hypothetical protein
MTPLLKFLSFQNVNGIKAIDEFVAASEIAYNANVIKWTYLHGGKRTLTGTTKKRHECDKHFTSIPGQTANS